MQSINESMIQSLDEKFHSNSKFVHKDKDGVIKPKKKFNKPDKSEETETAKKFKDYFHKDNFRITVKKKEWYVKFSTHAMARYIERGIKLDNDWLNDLLTKMIKIISVKEKNKMFLIYSTSMKQALVVTKTADDSFKVVTVYPTGENINSKGTQKILIESLMHFIDESIEID